MTKISTVAADEAEALLWWDVERVAGGIRCRIWIVRHADDEPLHPGAAERPARAPDFEEIVPGVVEAVDFLAGEDVCLHARAADLLAQLG